MSYLGTWRFHSIGTMRDDGEMVYLTADEYLKEPVPSYIDETDEEAVADELRERKILISMQIKICEGGKLYLLAAIPEDATQEQLDEAIASGELTLMDGMLCQQAVDWEERNGELWFDTGIEGEAFDEPTDSWAKAIDENGFFVFITTRFAKAE